MALKKSQLYSSLWQSCDELRGGMDASQYKDYYSSPQKLDRAIRCMLACRYQEEVWHGKHAQESRCGIQGKSGLEAIREEKTVARIAAEHGVHPNQIRQWRQKLLEEVSQLFSDRRRSAEKDSEELQSELYRQIGQLKVELDWLKKKSQMLLLKKKGD